ncbi:MAG: PAS domain-containing protein [Erythrobacter sp.]
MDSLRGNFDAPDFTDLSSDFDLADEVDARDLPPAAIGQDERRMQVRAYNHWASMLGERNFPSIEELEPENLPDFGPYSVLLDFSTGIEDPAVQYLGDELATECGAEGQIRRLSDVPSRSLLSRITDHYLQILANQAPIGFEAEFVNQRGATILYRGILLPYSSDNDTIDFIYGVINWKEMADQASADELLLQIDQALETEEDEPVKRDTDPVTDWADGPSADGAADFGFAESNISNIGSFGGFGVDDSDEFALPEPEFGDYALDAEFGEEDEEEGEARYDFASLTDHIAPPAKKALSLDLDELAAPPPVPEVSFAADAFATPAEPAPTIEQWDGEFDEPVIAASAELPADAGLYDFLAAAREAAETARTSEDRSRQALYAAVSQAYDFSVAAQEAPEDYAELLEDCGIAAQERAPMTPIVKLVFGSDYDKTRLTEYAAVLGYAHRVGIAPGGLGTYLAEAAGGLKGVVNAERRWRREQAGQQVEPEGEVRKALAKKLRKLAPQEFADIAPEGGEFALVMIRRTEAGEIVVLGEIAEDIALIERAARKLIG